MDALQSRLLLDQRDHRLDVRHHPLSPSPVLVRLPLPVSRHPSGHRFHAAQVPQGEEQESSGINMYLATSEALFLLMDSVIKFLSMKQHP